MLELMVILVVVSSFWAAFDSYAQEVTTDDSKRFNGVWTALHWLFICLALWIVAFPFYLSRRAKILRQNS